MSRPTSMPVATSPSPSAAAAAAHGAAIDLLRRHSLTTLVLRELQRQIVGGELCAGAKLNEADIAARLRVSRGPVREAFRALEQSGLVRTEKNRGVFVRELSLQEADEIYEVRAALDAAIGRLAARRIDAAALRRLRGVVKRMRIVARARDVSAYLPLNIEFHELLADAAGNAALQANYRRVVDELNLFRQAKPARDADHLPASTQGHAAIVETVAAGDGEAAARLLYEHAIASRDRLHAALGMPHAVTRSLRCAPRKER